TWVEPDPLKSRAVDPLGLQIVGDRLADQMIPGLSILTTRARYFTFLCWARRNTSIEREIHQFEAALAITEDSLSKKDPDGHECGFVGKRNIKTFLTVHSETDALRTDPRRIYKIPVWRAYRASMVDLKLLDNSRDYPLTDQGADAARAFQKAIRR